MPTTSFANPISGFAPAGQAIVQKPDGSAVAYTALASASAASTSGDTIFVGPGTYDEVDLAKNGVNWQLADGALIRYTGSSTKAIFDDNGTPCSFTIGGHGIIDHRGMSGGGCFRFASASDVSVTAAQLHSQGIGAVLNYSGNGLMFIKTERFTSGAYGAGAYLSGGRVYIEASEMKLDGSGDSIRTSWGETYITVGLFGGATLTCAGGLQHFISQEASGGSSTGFALCTGGTQVIEFEEGGAPYAQSVPRIICNGGSQSIHFIHFEPNDSNAAGFQCTSGTQRIFGQRYKNGSHHGFNVDAGKQYIDILDAETTLGDKFTLTGTGGTQIITGHFKNSGTNGVAANLGGQTLVIEGHATLVSHSGATDSIVAGSATNVTLQGFACGNKATTNVSFLVAPSTNAVFSNADVV